MVLPSKVDQGRWISIQASLHHSTFYWLALGGVGHYFFPFKDHSVTTPCRVSHSGIKVILTTNVNKMSTQKALQPKCIYLNLYSFFFEAFVTFFFAFFVSSFLRSLLCLFPLNGEHGGLPCKRLEIIQSKKIMIIIKIIKSKKEKNCRWNI